MIDGAKIKSRFSEIEVQNNIEKERSILCRTNMENYLNHVTLEL